MPTQVGTGAWSSLALGRIHACAIKPNGSLWCWGSNWLGDLGIGSSHNNRLVPTLVGTHTWSSVSGGDKHTCGVRTDSSLWCWGDNSWAQLGAGTRGGFKTVPTRVGTGVGWASVEDNSSTSCALRADGSLWRWAGFDGHVFALSPTEVRI